MVPLHRLHRPRHPGLYACTRDWSHSAPRRPASACGGTVLACRAMVQHSYMSPWLQFELLVMMLPLLVAQ